MNISYNWLSQYVDISCGLKVLAEKLTMAGIEVEAIEEKRTVPAGVVVAEILERKPHPDADKLSVCRVFDGKEELQIVCGAPNCDAGKKVPLATIGTVFVDSESGKEFAIKKSKLRGVESNGMLCSAMELGLAGDHSGLLELSAHLQTGTSLLEIHPGDTMIEVEVTPNRPDWLSHWGIARDVSCLLNTVAVMPEITLPAPSGTDSGENLVTVEDKELCPRYTARIIRNVKVQDSPEWLKERLLSIGMRPINNIVDITNFVLMELGHPLHAFDLNKLAEQRIVVRRATDGEKFTSLDGSELELKTKHLVIADAKKPVALAGVMGGLDSGVTGETVNLLLESAAFFSSNIRATSRELGISSDSSYRFERGIDWNMVETASDRATALILELAGGTLTSELIDVRGAKPQPPVIICRFDRIRKLIGIDMPNSRIVDIFRKLYLDVLDITGEQCLVTPPLFRLDLEREADLAEEVARVNGLEAIPVIPVMGKMVASINKDSYLKYQELREELIALGLYECMHYSMVKEQSALADTRFTADDLVKIGNPLSLDLACMRPSLFGEMLESVERNISRRNLNLKLFEMGRVFCANQQLFPEERIECCLVLSGQKHPERFSGELKDMYDFYDLKGLLESLLMQRDLVNFTFEKNEDGRFMPGKCAVLKIDGKVAGHLGELAAVYTRGLRTEHPVFVAMFEADAVIKAKVGSILYKPFSPYPAVTRDVAFIAANSLEHRKVVEFISASGLKNLEKIELFDIFIDEKAVGQGKKSMAYTLTFRNPERTLTDKEVNNAFERLRSKLAAELKVELR